MYKKRDPNAQGAVDLINAPKVVKGNGPVWRQVPEATIQPGRVQDVGETESLGSTLDSPKG